MISVRQLRTVAAAAVVFAMTTTAPIVAFSPDDVERLQTTHNCGGCDLSGARLPALAANRSNLMNANLSGAFLYKAQLRGANLTGAILRGANLSSANLSNAIGANLSGAHTDRSTVCPNGAAGPCK